MYQRSFIKRPLINYIVLVDGQFLHHSPNYTEMVHVVKDWRAKHAHCMSNRIKMIAK